MSAGESDAKSRRRSSEGAEGERAGGATAGRAGGPALPLGGAALDRRPPEEVVPAVSFVADEIAMASVAGRMQSAAGLEGAEPVAVRCDACDQLIEGEPGGRGLLYWTRGEDMRLEEPPLCESCAVAVTASAHRRWDVEEEEG
jgi:hypothetical protein